MCEGDTDWMHNYPSRVTIDRGAQFYWNEEQFKFLLLIYNQICNMYFSIVITPNMFFLNFSKITIFSLISLFSVHSVC
jgi:hypothetical protein